MAFGFRFVLRVGVVDWLVWAECYCFSVVWLFLLMVILLLLVNSVVYYVHFTVGLTFVALNLFVLGYMVRGLCFCFMIWRFVLVCRLLVLPF